MSQVTDHVDQDNLFHLLHFITVSMDSDSEIFLTQSTFDTVINPDTDDILSDVLDTESGGTESQPNFTIKSSSFSDVSDDELLAVTD